MLVAVNIAERDLHSDPKQWWRGVRRCTTSVCAAGTPVSATPRRWRTAAAVHITVLHTLW
jgi:hypothetical protein